MSNFLYYTEVDAEGVRCERWVDMDAVTEFEHWGKEGEIEWIIIYTSHGAKHSITAEEGNIKFLVDVWKEYVNVQGGVVERKPYNDVPDHRQPWVENRVQQESESGPRVQSPYGTFEGGVRPDIPNGDPGVGEV